MNETKLAHFKKLLLDEKARVEGERAAYVNDDRADTEEGSAGELSDNDVNDPADEATNLYDRERDRAAIDNMNRILSKINRALEKIGDGTYGQSDVDGSHIPVARLEALPYALTTVDQEDAF